MSSSPVLDLSPESCSLMGLIDSRVSEESEDYVKNKTQFQLHSMLTEQRHPNTMNMSQTITADTPAGLTQLLSVDDDITKKIQVIQSDAAAMKALTSIQDGFLRSVESKRRIYVYGCGATGRLAKLMESTFWRSIWRRIQSSPLWETKIKATVSATIIDDMVGETTGADRALISSLEGFEDLQLIGALQLQDHGIQKGDMVVAVTEGGETSSVIGTVLEGYKQWAGSNASSAEIASHLFFVYNNPDHLLLPFHRSASVIQNENITKLNLATGPQAITGSTRMQATTSETYVIACALHMALEVFLRSSANGPHLTPEEMKSLGFDATPSTLQQKLNEFNGILQSVKDAIPALARFTRWESECYGSHNKFTTYFAQQGLMTVFIDSTERSPTFRLFPLDTTTMQAAPNATRKCWLQVWTSAASCDDAWLSFLGRKFKGLTREKYEAPFQQQIEDKYLREVALRSLPNGLNDQAPLYDFSFRSNIARRNNLQGGDLGVLVLMNGEEEQLRDSQSEVNQYVRLFIGKNASETMQHDQQNHPTRLSIVILSNFSSFASDAPLSNLNDTFTSLLVSQNDVDTARVSVCCIRNSVANDPLNLRAQIAMKIALNAHSTGVMAMLGKVLGNCMINVSPSNLKLIGRATFLILSHVNEYAAKCNLPQVSYALVNAVLYDSITLIKNDQAAKASSGSATVAAAPVTGAIGGQSAEVALSIIRMLSSLAAGKPLTGADSLRVLEEKGLAKFLQEFALQHAASK